MPSTTLTIEEVYGGGGNSGAVYKNDYIVLHNLTNAAISLAGYSLQYASTTGAFSVAGASSFTALSGSIPAGGYFLVQETAGAGGAASLPTPDVTGSVALSGTGGKVALSSSATAAVTGPTDASVIDFVGWGTANAYEGAGAAPATTNPTSVVRGNDGNLDTDNNATDFTTATPSNTGHVPYNSASTPHPANGGGATSLAIGALSLAEGNSGTTAFTFTVTRSGDLSGVTTVDYATADGTATTADGDYAAASGTLTFGANVQTQTITVQVNGDTKVEPNETFAVNLSNPTAGVTFGQQSATGTITNDDVTLIGIADIQGASQLSPYAGSTVTTSGVVTALKTGSGGGFYIQDSGAGGPAGASHGLFVFTANTPAVAVGDSVTVTGLVTEYLAGNNNLPVTELNNPAFTVGTQHNTVTPVVIGQGGVLPPTSVIAPATPYNPATSGADFYESLEGQLVTIHNARAVDATYSGSTWVVADNGAEVTGLNARGGITVSATDFNPERIQVYSTALNASMGEQLGDITGVLTYYSANSSSDPSIGGEYELIPTAAITPPGGQSPSTAPTLARPTTALKGDATHVSIGAYNVENLGPSQPSTPQTTVDARFAQLGRDIAQNLQSPDILGLEEIQDADGEGSGTDLSGAATLNKLIAAIAAAGGPTYQYVEIAPTTANTNGGASNGNIRTAYLYNPARVSYVAGSAQLISDPNLSDGDAFANSRKPLAAQFTFNGQTINAIDIHDYARSGSQELFGQTQPPVNSGDQRRVDQTAAVKAYVTQLLAADPSAHITVQGDFNGFQFEPTLTQLTHANGGQLTNLTDLLAPNERYSTTFEGDAQQIDNLLVSDTLLPGAAFDIVHLNTGQPAAAQGSDHDPIVSLLSVPAATPVNHAPTVSGLPTSASAPSGGAVVLAPALTVSDADAGATATGARVAITAGLVAGDRLTVSGLPTGVTATYDGATGVLTLAGAASDAAYATALQHVSFTHDGSVDAGTRTVSFTVTDDQAATSAAATETVSVAGYVPPAGGGGGVTPTPPANLDVQQGFPTQTGNLTRASSSDPALSTPTSPLYAQAQAEKVIAAQLDSGQIGLADAQSALYHLVDGTVSVAEIAYAFFTGKTPTAAGLNYLVHSSANPTDLNDSYYQQFTTENRYINFANNLATGVGEGAATFQASYGSLSLSDAVTKAYTAIFGVAPAAGKVDAILNAQVSNGLGGTETRAQYFADITGGSASSQKAAAIGFLLADSVKEGFGAYQQADLHFLADLAHGTAVFNVDLLAAYTAAPNLVGQPTTDASLGG